MGPNGQRKGYLTQAEFRVKSPLKPPKEATKILPMKPDFQIDNDVKKWDIEQAKSYLDYWVDKGYKTSDLYIRSIYQMIEADYPEVRGKGITREVLKK